MKKTRSVIFTAIITLLAFGAAIYTSCNKDRCSNVACQNGGTCVNGYCSCTYGYEGDHCEIRVKTTIEYWNHGFTDITLTLNNVAYTVPPGRSKGFQGGYGDTLQGLATTQGQYGRMIRWDSLFTLFPQSGTTTIDLHIPQTYFFLRVINDSSSSLLKEFRVNWRRPNEVDFIVSPPYEYQSYHEIGYFPLDSFSNLYMKSTTGAEWYDSLHLPLVQDQYYTAFAN